MRTPPRRRNFFDPRDRRRPATAEHLGGNWTVLLRYFGVAAIIVMIGASGGVIWGGQSARLVERPADAYYAHCAEARAEGAAPVYRNQPGYRPQLDNDNDGIACEPYRGRR